VATLNIKSLIASLSHVVRIIFLLFRLKKRELVIYRAMVETAKPGEMRTLRKLRESLIGK